MSFSTYFPYTSSSQHVHGASGVMGRTFLRDVAVVTLYFLFSFLHKSSTKNSPLS